MQSCWQRSLVRSSALGACKTVPYYKRSRICDTITRSLSTNIAPQPSMLVRDFISSSLYDHSTGYFSTTDCVFSSPEGPNSQIEFQNLFGKLHYIQKQHQLYQTKGREQSWVTPVELFKPWYSYAIAAYIVQEHIKHCQGSKLRIVEVGGGNGTNAYHILAFLREKYPDVYNTTEYTLVEISPTLAQRQQSLLEKSHDKGKFSIINQSFLDLGDSDVSSEQDHCFVLAMEVFDNLPHDKLTWVEKNDSTSNTNSRRHGQFPTWAEKEKLGEVWVVEDNDPSSMGYKEQVVPLSDPLVVRTAELYLGADIPRMPEASKPWSFNPFKTLSERLKASAKEEVLKQREEMENGYSEQGNTSVFIPTGAVQFLEQLLNRFPKHSLIAADFDQLPAPEVPEGVLDMHKSIPRPPGSLLGCKNFPLVSTRDSKSGEVTDHLTYFVPKGSCDIFFQTNFEKLANSYTTLGGGDATVTSSREFLGEHADVKKTKTRSGYNPLLEDFENTKFLLASTI